MIVVAYTPAGEVAVMVSAHDAHVADGAVVGARRRVVLAVGTVGVAGLVDHGQRHSPARRVCGQQEPVVEHRVDEEEGHVAHSEVVGGEPLLAGEHDRGDVEHAVQVGHGNHHRRERHGQSVRRRARQILTNNTHHTCCPALLQWRSCSFYCPPHMGARALRKHVHAAV